MAQTISDEELQLKRRARRRLIGAVVLVAAIVVILPMVLDTEPKPVSRDITVQIPSPSASSFAPKVAMPAAPAETPAPGGEAAKVPGAEAPSPKRAPAESAKAEAPPPKPAPVEAAKAEALPPRPAPVEIAKAEASPPKPVPAKAAAKPAEKAANGKYVVQVIALADAGRAKQMRGRIEDAGIPAYTEVVKTAKGDVTRVRAGPFATRGAAEKASERLKALGMNGNIVAR
jgi:DedD protein